MLGDANSLLHILPLFTIGQVSMTKSHLLTLSALLIKGAKKLLFSRERKWRKVPFDGDDPQRGPSPESCFVSLALGRDAREDQVAGEEDDLSSGIWD